MGEEDKVNKSNENTHPAKKCFNMQQIVLWTSYAWKILVVNLFVLPSTAQLSTRIVLFALFNSTMGLTIGLCAIMTLRNVGESVSKNSDKVGVELPPESDTIDANVFCSFCNIRVPLECKHCSQCNQCVRNFDHHCTWLNNCICSKNYKMFIILLIECSLIGVLIVYLCIEFIVSFHGQSEVMSKQSLCNFYNITDDQSMWTISYVLTWTCLLVCCITESLISTLLIFHCYLRLMKLSTYDFIKNRRDRKINKINSIQNEINKIREQINKEVGVALQEDSNNKESCSSFRKDNSQSKKTIFLDNDFSQIQYKLPLQLTRLVMDDKIL